jgi:hypothetical protein
MEQEELSRYTYNNLDCGLDDLRVLNAFVFSKVSTPALLFTQLRDDKWLKKNASQTAILFTFHNISDVMSLPISARNSYCVAICKTTMFKVLKKHTFQSSPLSVTGI